MIRRRLSMRSASAPVRGEASIGASARAMTMPTANSLRVSSKTYQPKAVRRIQDPVSEIPWPKKKRR